MTTLRKLTEDYLKLKTDCFKEIAGAADLAAILKSRKSVPGCYLFRKSINASKNNVMSSVNQKEEHIISTIIITNNVRDARGTDSSDENEELSNQVKATLLGWPASDEYTNFHYAGGSLISFTGGLFIWQDSYKTTKRINSN